MLKKISDFVRYISDRRLAYQKVFDSKNGDVHIVLTDLARFCRAHDSTFQKDERLHAVLEGRREVWLRIMENLKLNEDEIYALHRVREFVPEKET